MLKDLEVNDVVKSGHVSRGDHFDFVVEDFFAVHFVFIYCEFESVIYDEVAIELAKRGGDVAGAYDCPERLVWSEFLLEKRKVGSEGRSVHFEACYVE